MCFSQDHHELLLLFGYHIKSAFPYDSFSSVSRGKRGHISDLAWPEITDQNDSEVSPQLPLVWTYLHQFIKTHDNAVCVHRKLI